MISIALASIASLIPISLAGWGTHDATPIFLFLSLRLTQEYAINLSLLVLLIVLNRGLGLLLWLRYPWGSLEV